VTGGRLKLGYQIALKLLRAGAEVIVTSRKWSEALDRYHNEPDFDSWKDRLHVFQVNFDLLIIDELLPMLQSEIERVWPDGCVDIIVHNAAQTIFNVPEKIAASDSSPSSDSGDAAFLKEEKDTDQESPECEEAELLAKNETHEEPVDSPVIEQPLPEPQSPEQQLPDLQDADPVAAADVVPVEEGPSDLADEEVQVGDKRKRPGEGLFVPRKQRKLDRPPPPARGRYPPQSWAKNPFPEVDKYNRLLEHRETNTWTTPFGTVVPAEAKQVLIANAWAPFVLNQFLVPYLNKSAEQHGRKSFVIHVHAKEGHFGSHKTLCHTHTNMAKSGLCMMTRCLSSSYSTRWTRWNYQTALLEGEGYEKLPWSERFTDNLVQKGRQDKESQQHRTIPNISIHGVDPGWFSLDEYHLQLRKDKNLLFPPIDEIDAASRIVYPIFKNLDSFPGTWRHYIPLLDF
jgi:NAD(P)-dependent dehydrogenase (short-subunit alcohol dehydrogenase family)